MRSSVKSLVRQHFGAPAVVFTLISAGAMFRVYTCRRALGCGPLHRIEWGPIPPSRARGVTRRPHPLTTHLRASRVLGYPLASPAARPSPRWLGPGSSCRCVRRYSTHDAHSISIGLKRAHARRAPCFCGSAHERIQSTRKRRRDSGGSSATLHVDARHKQ